jgi:antibiotic biosynthesis monooxygenase (ABM) superfamily enzyme
MAVTVIDADADVITLITAFTVDPVDQRTLVDILATATEEVIRYLPGFVAANIHASTDGTKVVNYAQWSSEEMLRAMLANPSAREHLTRCSAIATPEPAVYTVESVHHR